MTVSTRLKKMKFLTRANNLASQGEIDKGLDVLYTGIKKMIWDGKFDQLNMMIGETDPETLTTDIILGVLTCTMKSNFPPGMGLVTRPDFYERARKTILNREVEEHERLLSGLEL